MIRLYFVGGPKAGQAQEFFRRLEKVGGPPAGWRILPHAAGDGKALHLIEAESRAEVERHLRHFDGIYEYGDIIEIVETPR